MDSKRAITAIGFDADDTLWQNESFFRLTEQRFTTSDTNSDGWLSTGELLRMRRGMRAPGGSE